MLADWLQAVRTRPVPARQTRAAVLETMGRRGDSLAIRDCFRAGGVSGSVRLRFQVAVVSAPEALRVGAATFVEADDGPPVSDDTARCIEEQLAGDDLIAFDGRSPFLPAYRGDVDYDISFDIPP